MTNDSSVRDGATGASDSFHTLWSSLGMGGLSELLYRLERYPEELVDCLHELRRHLCKCGHWMREHDAYDGMGYTTIGCDAKDCGCCDFTPEESDALAWDDLNRAKELADIALEESDES